MTTLINAVVLVTGANGGLGQQFVQQALNRGAAKVYAAARTPRDWGNDRIVPLQLDVTDPTSVRSAADQATDVTVVVNNAGILRRGSLTEGPLADIREQMETNLFGAIHITRDFAPALKAHGGAVINVASVLSWLAIGKGYSVSKAALWAATNAFRLELAPEGVQVLGAYLAFTDTPMNDGMTIPEMNRPADVVNEVYDGLESDAHEVLADETTRTVREGLSSDVGVLYPALRSETTELQR
ncbi:SDR family oxidoreductase [Leifsonia sp. RAF41]|uniref:SDR family oxidoreductase n=1 Tax=Leifsonia sp. RAF41 TaxID=3233056 RepID=UPI003F9D3A99